MYVAIDDTDSRNWMCTTFLATELIRELAIYDLIGHPRLVRLNPAVPWKTRGNGAICLRFGRGGGSNHQVGEVDGRKVIAYQQCLEPADASTVWKEAMAILRSWSMVHQGASPGVVISERKPNPSLYWSGVRGILEKDEVELELDAVGARRGGLAGCRGIIGAAAAMSWRPRDRTYELLAYRERERWGTERVLDEASVIAMDREFPSTFNNYDYDEGKIVISPCSPCPILYGIRGDNPDELVTASQRLRSERMAGHLIFLTNQATDDHIIRSCSQMEFNQSYSVRGRVSVPPRDLKGGHVVVGITVEGRELDVTAYEPSKGFRKVVRSLAPGDEVRVIGELRQEPCTLNLEKLEVIDLACVTRKLANPTCPKCGRRMKSAGRYQGYRCKRCGTNAPPEAAPHQPEARGIGPGWYQPPVSARRHLSMPLERMGTRPTSSKVE